MFIYIVIICSPLVCQPLDAYYKLEDCQKVTEAIIKETDNPIITLRCETVPVGKYKSHASL